MLNCGFFILIRLVISLRCEYFFVLKYKLLMNYGINERCFGNVVINSMISVEDKMGMGY